MSYVIAAYSITGATLILYWIHLARESRALRAEIAAQDESANPARRNSG